MAKLEELNGVEGVSELSGAALKPISKKSASTKKAAPKKAAAQRYKLAKSVVGYEVLINFYQEVRPKLVTLDIFDTVLLRDASSEPRRFLEIAKLQSEFLAKSGYTIAPEDLLRARLAAADLAYRFTAHVSGAREASVDEIYIAMFAMLRIKRSMLEPMLEIELRYEAGSLAINEDIIRFIKLLKQEGVPTLLLTDMYLRAQDVRKVLEFMDAPSIIAELELISSAETKLPKASGSAFIFVADRFKLATGDIMHIGDNDLNEILPAIKAGVKALHAPRSESFERARRADLAKLHEELCF